MDLLTERPATQLTDRVPGLNFNPKPYSCHDIQKRASQAFVDWRMDLLTERPATHLMGRDSG